LQDGHRRLLELAGRAAQAALWRLGLGEAGLGLREAGLGLGIGGGWSDGTEGTWPKSPGDLPGTGGVVLSGSGGN
jgi:hypothetical protein